MHVSSLWVLLMCALCLGGGCEEEQDAENPVPERLWAAAVAYCEWHRDCHSAYYGGYQSIEQCASYATISAWS